ncbi:MAG: dual specificity protein phosphatase 23 [Fimbriiglobus sp.]|jgi:atypical dual specificity phosphatase|nr:dual specificity protein phosphatase 23 [Fimbriiglobus sp.]
MPYGFTWIDPPHLAALARPDADDLAWLREHGVQVLITLTESPLPRKWVNDAGLMGVHIPVPDMEAPSDGQLRQAVDTIDRAKRSGLGVAVHCAAGKGRTGTVLAAYLVSQGLTAAEAIHKVRDLRPGSVETPEQERAVREWEKNR